MLLAGYANQTGVVGWLVPGQVVLNFDSSVFSLWSMRRLFEVSLMVVDARQAGVAAILATLAILVWHGYSTVFSPHVYPMNPAWLGGKMPEDMYTREHPEGPRLKAQTPRVLDEEKEGVE